MSKHTANNQPKQVSDQALAAQVESLPKEMQPQRDLWSGIERAIQSKSQQPMNEGSVIGYKNVVVPMSWAASIVAAVLLTWYSFTPTISPSTDDVLVKTQGASKQAVSGIQLVNLMQVNFKQQKQAMLVSFGQPDIKKLPVKMQNQLAVLAQARTAIEKALLNDENNVDLLNLLRFTQQQELDLLQQLFPHMNNSSWQSI